MRPAIPIAVRRFAYRIGYVLLVGGSRVARPRSRGVKCLVACGGAVMLVRHSYGPRQWDLPGGFCRRGEAFADAARRELAEELGLATARWTDLGEHPRTHHGRRETLGFFRAEVDEQGGLAVDRAELTDVRWFAREELPVPRAPIVEAVLASERRLEVSGT